MWTRPGNGGPLAWALRVQVWSAAENRLKSDEILLSTPDSVVTVAGPEPAGSAG